jgi:prepilin-type N-terminal cleavage/methylation domain-containing protein
MKTVAKTTHGFTLIEIVTVIVVLSILGGFSYRFLDSAIATYGMAKKQGGLQQDAVLILERISRELSDAVSVTSPGVSVSSVENELSFNTSHKLKDNSTSITFRRNNDAKKTLSRMSSTSTSLIGKNVERFTIERVTSTGCGDYFRITIRMKDVDDAQREMAMATAVRPKNVVTNLYSDRCFNGDYEDTVK